MLIISYITQKNTASRNLEESLKKYGYRYIFLGIGKKWKGFVKGKICGIVEFLETCKEDLVCVIDGYDVLACRPVKDLLKKYKSARFPIIVGGEKFCFTYNGTPVEKYKNISLFSSRKYPNGGFCVGDRIAILEMYRYIIAKGEKEGINDDQKLLGRYINAYPDQVSIDLYQNIVFNTITTIDNNAYTQKQGGIYIPCYDSYPCFIHFPSNSSDGYGRYNRYGKSILGKRFKCLYGEKTWNFFANIPTYVIALFLLLYFSGKYSVLILVLVLIILKNKIAL
jgi:hypothetical protein